MVAKYDYRTVEKYYINEDRYIKEQVLDLNESEKILLYNILEQNIRPKQNVLIITSIIIVLLKLEMFLIMFTVKT